MAGEGDRARELGVFGNARSKRGFELAILVAVLRGADDVQTEVRDLARDPLGDVDSQVGALGWRDVAKDDRARRIRGGARLRRCIDAGWVHLRALREPA